MAVVSIAVVVVDPDGGSTSGCDKRQDLSRQVRIAGSAAATVMRATLQAGHLLAVGAFARLHVPDGPMTDAVLEDVCDGRHRPLDPVYPVVFFDALQVKIRDEGQVRKKAACLTPAVTCRGEKEVLGLPPQGWKRLFRRAIDDGAGSRHAGQCRFQGSGRGAGQASADA